MAKRVSIFILLFFALIFLYESLFAEENALRGAETLILRGRYEEAVEECRRVLAHHHHSKIRPKTFYLLGVCLLKKARYEQAREEFNIILRKYPQSQYCDEASLGIADSYYLAGDFNQANKKYEEFLKNSSRSHLSSIARERLEQSKQRKYFASSYFSVQIGCFTNKNNAVNLRNELIDKGYQAYLLQLPGESLYRVRVGKFGDRLEAEFLERKLKARGYPTKVCP